MILNFKKSYKFAFISSLYVSVLLTLVLSVFLYVFYKLNFEYKDMNKVMRIIKEQKLSIENQIMELNCEFLISVRKKNALKVQQLFLDLRCLKIKEVTT